MIFSALLKNCISCTVVKFADEVLDCNLFFFSIYSENEEIWLFLCGLWQNGRVFAHDRKVAGSNLGRSTCR